MTVQRQVIISRNETKLTISNTTQNEPGNNYDRPMPETTY